MKKNKNLNNELTNKFDDVKSTDQKQEFFKLMSDYNFKFDLIRNILHNLITCYTSVSVDLNYIKLTEKLKKMDVLINDTNDLLSVLIKDLNLKF